VTLVSLPPQKFSLGDLHLHDAHTSFVEICHSDRITEMAT